jgi:hypothetical protein
MGPPCPWRVRRREECGVDLPSEVHCCRVSTPTGHDQTPWWRPPSHPPPPLKTKCSTTINIGLSRPTRVAGVSVGQLESAGIRGGVGHHDAQGPDGLEEIPAPTPPPLAENSPCGTGNRSPCRPCGFLRPYPDCVCGGIAIKRSERERWRDCRHGF